MNLHHGRVHDAPQLALRRKELILRGEIVSPVERMNNMS